MGTDPPDTDKHWAEVPSLLTVEDLAEILNLSQQSIYRLTRAGVIPSIRLHSRALRYRPGAVLAALESLEDNADHRETAPRAKAEDKRSGRTRSGPRARVINLGRIGKQ